MSVSTPATLRPDGWLPDAQSLELWLSGQKERIDPEKAEPLAEEVQELGNLIDGDPVIPDPETRTRGCP